MKKLFFSFIMFYSLFSINAVVCTEIPASLIARLDDPQVPSLRNWSQQVVPRLNLEVLDFEKDEAMQVLSDLNLEFIPAVVFRGPLPAEDTEFLKERFGVVAVKDYWLIPRNVMQELALLELYKRRIIPRQLDLFVMSHCVACHQAQVRLINYMRNHRLKIRLKFHYLVEMENGRFSSLHGEEELREDKRQLIIQKYWPKIFFDYILLRQKKSYLNTLEILKLNPQTIERKLPETEALLLKDYALAQELQIQASPTFLWQNRYLVSHLEQLNLIAPFNQEVKIKETPSSSEGPLKILMFHSPRCRACQDIKEDFLPQLVGKYKDRIEMVHYDINEPRNFSYLLELEGKYGILDRGSIPKIFAGDSVLLGAAQIREKLEDIILAHVASPREGPVPAEVRADQFQTRILELFKTFTVGAVCWAGLTDGINPCAFTTLIFFLSFLSFAGYKKRQVLYLGTFFIIAVFFTYFLLGLGAFKFILKLKIYSTVAEVFYYAVGILVLVLGVISLCDSFRFMKTKRIEDIKLKLPQAVKRKIQSVIGRGYRKDKTSSEATDTHAHPFKLVSLAVVIGFIVSILESVCTGQVYLPTITFITKVPALKMRAISYLLLYNLMFIVPLVIIFALAMFGLTSEGFSRFTQRHLAKIKLATALFFFSLFFLLWKLR